MTMWTFANLGYDTSRNLWFIECYDAHGQVADFHTAGTLKVVNGWGNQFQFRDERPDADLWHVRERIFSADVASIELQGNVLTITFVNPTSDFSRSVPEAWDYLLYAYRLRGPIPWGFVEFYDAGGKQVAKLLGLWIAVEHLDHFTVGTYPDIRFRVNKEAVKKIVLTDFNMVIVGKAEKRANKAADTSLLA